MPTARKEAKKAAKAEKAAAKEEKKMVDRINLSVELPAAPMPTLTPMNDALSVIMPADTPQQASAATPTGAEKQTKKEKRQEKKEEKKAAKLDKKQARKQDKLEAKLIREQTKEEIKLQKGENMDVTVENAKKAGQVIGGFASETASGLGDAMGNLMPSPVKKLLFAGVAVVGAVLVYGFMHPEQVGQAVAAGAKMAV